MVLRDRVAGSRPGPIGGHNNNSDVQFMQQIAGTTKDQGPALPVTKDKSSARAREEVVWLCGWQVLWHVSFVWHAWAPDSPMPRAPIPLQSH